MPEQRACMCVRERKLHMETKQKWRTQKESKKVDSQNLEENAFCAL